MVHAFQLLFIDCNYPKAFVWWIGMHAVMFFFLFNEFYKAAYKGRRAVSFEKKKYNYYYMVNVVASFNFSVNSRKKVFILEIT